MKTQTATILVVDDTEATRYAVVRHLQRAGYSTREAASAREARELARSKPDLVILDVKLPDGLGYDVCREIKADPDTSSVPVLHISATFRMASDRVKGLDSGADGFLTGPVEPDELLANVKLLLRLREATASMRQARERLESVLASITDLYCSLDNEGRFLELNAAAEKAFGGSAAVLTGKRFSQAFPHGIDRLFYTAFQAARRDGAPVHGEGYSAAAKGWFEIHVYPHEGSVEIYARDITERKHAEERLALALAAGEMGAYELDLAEGRLWWSPQAYATFGVHASTFAPSRQSFTDLIHPDDRDAFWNILHDSIQEGTPLVHQFRIVRPDGNLRWIGIRGKAEHEFAREPQRHFGIVVDITDQKSMEQRLESAVAERTAKLREMVGELESFSYTIAHDMRAPLRSLQGFSDILLQEHSEKLDSEGQGFLRRIASSAGRMDRLIQDVLSYSRIVRADLPLENVCLDTLVRDITATYPLFSTDQAEIVIDGRLPVVLGNEALLTQIVSNLIGNAVKFVKPGVKPRVRIWAEDVPSSPLTSAALGNKWQREHRKTRLFIEDQGIGIPADQHERIFGIFQRVDQGYDGTGIGLAIVRKAVERLGGQVGLRSELGHGSAFWIDLQRP